MVSGEECKSLLLVYAVEDEDPQTLDAVAAHVRAGLPVPTDNATPSMVQLAQRSRATSEGQQDVLSLTEYILRMARRHRVLHNDRHMVLSEEDTLVAVQLCLAERNKQKVGDFDVEVSKVVEYSRKLERDKLQEFSAQPNNTSFGRNLNASISAILNTSFDGGPSDPNNSFLALTKSSSEEEYLSFKVSYQEFQKSNNVLDVSDLLCLVRDEASGNEELKRNLETDHVLFYHKSTLRPVEMAALELLGQCRQVQSVAAAQQLGGVASHIEDVVMTDTSLAAVLGTMPTTTPRGKHTQSVTEAHVEQLMLGYLHLLVNSRSEIALARVINVPDRELDHKAFTDIKHQAKKKGLSMYQVCTSFVMKIRLGGKSYAPDPSCRLARHVKGLSEFTDLAHKLQTVIEEDVNSGSAIRRVLGVIKGVILKCQSNSLRRQSVEVVMERLEKESQAILTAMDATKEDSPKRTASNGGSSVGRRTLKAIRCLLDHYATQPSTTSTLNALTDVVSSQKTPVRFPSLLSQFRSPVEHSPNAKSKLSLAERMKAKKLVAKKSQSVSYRANMEWAQPAHDLGWQAECHVPVLLEDYIPSKTIVERGVDQQAPFQKGLARRVLESICDQENMDSNMHGPSDSMAQCQAKNPSKTVENKTVPLTASSLGSKGSKKRPLEASQSQSSSNKRAKKSTAAAKTSKKKVVPLQKGQKTLATFFRI